LHNFNERSANLGELMLKKVDLGDLNIRIETKKKVETEESDYGS